MTLTSRKNAQKTQKGKSLAPFALPCGNEISKPKRELLHPGLTLNPQITPIYAEKKSADGLID
ncbi:MAG: hypothetical protein WBN22_08080 [Verrucomicrobiia bacterium]